MLGKYGKATPNIFKNLGGLDRLQCVFKSFAYSLFFYRDVFVEKHWKSVISRSVCDHFFEALSKVFFLLQAVVRKTCYDRFWHMLAHLFARLCASITLVLHLFFIPPPPNIGYRYVLKPRTWIFIED